MAVVVTVGGFVVVPAVATSITSVPVSVPTGGGPVVLPVAVPPSRVTPATARMVVPVAHLGSPTGTRGEFLGQEVFMRAIGRIKKPSKKRDEKIL